MSGDIGRDALLRLLRDGGRRVEASTRIDRRAFLATTAAAATATKIEVASSAPLGRPDFSKQGRVLRTRFNGLTWDIDPACFGAAAYADAHLVGTRYQLRLERAHFPGTGIQASFLAWVYFDGAQWRIDIELAGAISVARSADIEPPLLESWMAGKVELDFRRPGRLRIGEVTISSATPHLVVTLDNRLRLTWQASTSVDLKLAKFQCNGGLIEASAGSNALLRDTLDQSEPLAHTTVQLNEAITLDPGIALARVGGAHHLTLELPRPRLSLVAFSDIAGRNEALITLLGPGAFIVQGRGLLKHGGKIPLERTALTSWATNPRHRVALAYAIQRTGFLFETDGFALLARGRGTQETLHINHAALARAIFPMEIEQAYVPVRGASMASVRLFGARASIQIAGSTPPEGCSTRAWIGSHCSLDLPLDRAALHLQRSIDHFDLKFEFRNYELRCVDGKTRLFERWAYAAGCDVSPNPPTLIAIFSPQHVQEQVFERKALEGLKFPNELAATAIAAPSRIAMQSRQPARNWEAGEELTIEHITDWEHLSLAVHARALPADASLLEQMQAVHLNPWTSRADARISILDSLSSAPGPEQTALEPVTGLIVSPDRSAWFATPRVKPPSAGGAELWTARLRLGKNSAVRALHARRASFGFMSGECQAPTPAAQRELHNFIASLSAQDRAELVVLMTAYAMPALRRLLASKDGGGDLIDDPKGMVVRPKEPLDFLSKETRKYEVSLPDGTKKEISVFQEGILLPQGYSEFDLTLSASKATLRSRWEGEPPAPLSSDPFFARALNIQGYIHRTVWGRDALVQVDYKGFLFPLGHRAALIKVSERQFLPAKANAEQIDPTAYLIQRYYIVCGRPSKSFPALGQPFKGREFPASAVDMVTLVTPEIVPVDTSKEETLDLHLGAPLPGTKPSCLSPGRSEAMAVGRVFWPRTRPGKSDNDSPPNRYGHEIQFEYRIDGHPQALRSPLVFVDNTAAHDAATIKALVEYYEDLPYPTNLVTGDPNSIPALGATGLSAKKFLRIASTGGVERKYAPALNSGETSFQTEYWVLGATGGVGVGVPASPPPPRTIRQYLGTLMGAQAETEEKSASFSMDALMEGADQPPFYPRVHRALIKMQPLDRLLGRPQGLIEVGYSNRYVVHAMEAAANPAEIYLDVLQPAIDLNVSEHGDEAGGVAKPNARLAAISRANGMIGGRGRSSPVTGARSLRAVTKSALPAGVPDADLKYDTSAALAGRFNAAEFLGGATADALLLGILPLKDVIRVVAIGMAPKLREVTEYADDTLAKTLPEIASAIDTVVAVAIRKGNDAAKRLLNNDKIHDPLQEFYPALASRSQRLRRTCERIAETDVSTLKERYPGLAGELYESGKDFVQGLEQVAANPTPQGLAEYLLELRNATEKLHALSDPAQLRKLVVDEVHAATAGLLADLSIHLFGAGKKLGAFDVAFGISGPDAVEEKRAAILRDIVSNPAAAVDRLKSSVIEQGLPGLFVEAFARLDDVRRQAMGRLSWARAELRDQVIDLLAQSDPYLRQLPVILKLGADFTNELSEALDKFDAASALEGGLPGLLSQLEEIARVPIEKLDITYTATVYDQARSAAGEQAVKWSDQVKRKKDEIASKPQDLRDKLEAELRILECERAVRLRASNLPRLTAIRALVERVVHQELQRQAQRLAATARAAVEDLLGQIASQVVSATNPALEASGHLIEFVARSANSALQNWCTGGAEATINELQKLVLGKTLADVLKTLGDLQVDLMAIAVPSNLPSERRAEAEAMLADARRWVAQAIEQGGTIQTALQNGLGSACASLEAKAEIIRRFDTLCRCRVRLLDNVISAVGAAVACQIQMLQGTARGMTLASAAARTPDLCKRINEVLGSLEALLHSPAEIAALKARASDVDKLGSPARAGTFLLLLSQLESKLDAAKQALRDIAGKCAATEAALRDVSTRLEEQRAQFVHMIEREERRLVGFILDHLLSTFFNPQAIAVLGNSLARTEPLVTAIYELHNGVSQSTDALIKSIQTAASGNALTELIAAIAQPGLSALQEANAAIQADAVLTKDVSDAFKAKDPVRALSAIGNLQAAWRAQEPGLVRAAQLLTRLVQALMRGQLSALFDFNQVREEIQRTLLGLLPTKISQTYDFDAKLEDFPSNDPVFHINRTASAADAPLASSANDLVLQTRVEVDLLKNRRMATLRGTVRPFDIRLLGSRLDLITVKFKGAEFSAGTDSKPTYTAELLGVEIGAMLEFIKALQAYFAPKPGNGPYFGITLFPPEAVAGYRYSAPIIPVGTLLVMNVAIDVSMHLPFDNRQATFRFAFASRELPFLISQPPYGGGGFVSLLANAKGIIGFEIQLEFGAVVPIEFGPLSAQGRVTAGIYLMSSVDARVLEGFVCAVGEGNIACFGISVNIAVRVRQQEGGRMDGRSTYSVSFRAGLADLSYSFTAQYTIQGGERSRGGVGGGGEKVAMVTSRASKGGGAEGGGGADRIRADRLREPADDRQWIRTKLPPKHSDWKRYRARVAV